LWYEETSEGQMFGAVTRFFRQFRRVRAASADVRRAHALYAEGLYAEVAELLKQVRTTSDRPGNNPFLFGAQTTVRLRAATLLSMAAAKVGDTAVALDAIAEGRSLWAGSGITSGQAAHGTAWSNGMPGPNGTASTQVRRKIRCTDPFGLLRHASR
jgi:hypothetical protein